MLISPNLVNELILWGQCFRMMLISKLKITQDRYLTTNTWITKYFGLLNLQTLYFGQNIQYCGQINQIFSLFSPCIWKLYPNTKYVWKYVVALYKFLTYLPRI